MNPLIVIPTYIAARASRAGSNVVALYDHATPISQTGELPRLLESLTHVPGAFNVCILVACNGPIEEQAGAKVHVIAEQFPQLNITVIGANELSLIQQRLEQLGTGRLQKEIGLVGYGAIRNLGLLVANATNHDSVVFLDDDEVVEDEDFMKKAVYGLGKLTKKGMPILAKSGFYLNAQGKYTSKSQDKWYNKFWTQGAAFNEWIEGAMRGPRLSRSNHVCGGCLAIHREAFCRVAFDPWIARGEDLDYMLNMRMYGGDVWFDNQWSLRHLPPRNRISDGLRFKQDAYRWVYEYRKIEFSASQIDLQRITADSLEPYPGPFLRPGIEKRIIRTAWLRSVGADDKASYAQAANAVKGEVSSYAERNCRKYFEFQFLWPEVMSRLTNDQVIQAALLQSRKWRSAASQNISAQVREAWVGTVGMQTAPEEPFDPNLDPGTTGEIRLNVAE